MPFDAEKALALMPTFGFARAPGATGTSRAAVLLVESFERLGFEVERPPWRISRAALPITLAGLVLWFWWCLGRALPSVGGLMRIDLAVFAVIGLLLILLGTHRIRAGPRPQGPARPVIAKSREASRASVRVLFLTTLDAPPPRWVRWTARGALVLGVVTGLALGIPGALTPLRPVPLIGPAFLLAHWSAYALSIFVAFGPRPEVEPGDNRTGLALLVELARSWSRGASGRVEVVFAASELGQALGLIRRVAEQADGRPTLVVMPVAPGIGTRLTLVGRGHSLGLAREAAESLWIPFVVRRRPPSLGSWGLPPVVGLAGERGATEVVLATLTASAQLATEIALRWARRHQGAAVGDDNRARSSQNPG
jgi:hypothetical protein